MTYKLSIGLKKTLKNVGIQFIIPAILFFLNSYQEWLSAESAAMIAPFIGGICYMIKNYAENKS